MVGGGWGSTNLFKTVFITILYCSSQTSGRNKEKIRYIIVPHIHSVSQLRPHPILSASYRSIHTYNIYDLFDYAGYASARASVEVKKKQDILSFHTYTAYTAARALVETKKK